MRAPERVETGRLVLRRPAATDVEAIFAYASDAEVTEYVGFARHHALADTIGFLRFSDAQWAEWPAGPYLIERRDEGTVVGGTGLVFETPQRAATGYVLARHAWGRGYATEALHAMVGVARDCGVSRLYALCHHAHRASARVLEKGGFTFEGVLRRHVEFPNLPSGGKRDVLCYSRILEKLSGTEGEIR